MGVQHGACQMKVSLHAGTASGLVSRVVRLDSDGSHESRGGHMYTSCTDTRDRDQSEIKRSSSKIGDDQAIKTSAHATRSRSRGGFVLGLRPYPTHPRLAIKGQGSFNPTIKRSTSKNRPDQVLIPVTGVSTAGMYVTTPCNLV